VERALTLPGDRDAIRWQASQVALDMVRMHLLYNAGETKLSSKAQSRISKKTSF
jgi:hypothetical protein